MEGQARGTMDQGLGGAVCTTSGSASTQACGAWPAPRAVGVLRWGVHSSQGIWWRRDGPATQALFAQRALLPRRACGARAVTGYVRGPS